MIFHIMSLNKVFDNNASIILQSQAFLPEVQFPEDFDGNLAQLVVEKDIYYRITNDHYEKYKQDGVSYLIVDGYLSDVTVVYADVKRDYVITDGVNLWLFTKPSYWDVSLGQGFLGRVPDIFCKYLVIPCCLLVLPSLIETYAERNKVSKPRLFLMRTINALGVCMGILVIYVTTVSMLWL